MVFPLQTTQKLRQSDRAQRRGRPTHFGGDNVEGEGLTTVFASFRSKPLREDIGNMWDNP